MSQKSPVTSKWIKYWARLKRRKGIIAISALVLGNLANLLAYVDKINESLSRIFGFRLLDFLHDNLVVTISLVFLVGYAFAFYWFYTKYARAYSGRRKALVTSLAVAVAAAVFLLNLWWLPPPPTPKPPRDLLARWVEIVFRTQDPVTGGIRQNAGDLSIRPQVWTTAQCLKGVLAAPVDLGPHVQQIRRAFEYIERTRHPNSNPEWPGTQEGWGLFEERPATVTEIAGWVVVAKVASVESKTKIWNDDELPRFVESIERDLKFLVSRQDAGGGWRPLEEQAHDFNRAYATAMALWGLVEARRSPVVSQRIGTSYDDHINKGIRWLLTRHDEKLGWVPNPDRRPQYERFDGLTAQILHVLSRAEQDFTFLENNPTYLNAERAFVTNAQLAGRPLGQNNRYHDYDVSFRPTLFALEPSTFLWFPWVVAELTHLSKDASLTEEERDRAAELRRGVLRDHLDEIESFVEAEFMYALAENLYCLSLSLEPQPSEPV
jgi:hypothetical protein